MVNIGSVVGTAPEILNGVYGASKAYVLAFTQSLHQELAGTGVRAQVVLPNAMATPFWDAAGRPLPKTMKIITAEDLVDAALADLDQEVKVSIPPLHDYAPRVHRRLRRPYSGSTDANRRRPLPGLTPRTLRPPSVRASRKAASYNGGRKMQTQSRFWSRLGVLGGVYAVLFVIASICSASPAPGPRRHRGVVLPRSSDDETVASSPSRSPSWR